MKLVVSGYQMEKTMAKGDKPMENKNSLECVEGIKGKRKAR